MSHDLPLEIDDFFAKAFAPAPERRFQTAFELVYDLSLLAGEQLEPFSSARPAALRVNADDSHAWRSGATQSLHIAAEVPPTAGLTPTPHATSAREASGKRKSAPPRGGLPAAGTERPWHNLPALLTRFVGREQELTELHQCVVNERLVTLAGCGGSGKTRLALELGMELLDTFYDGVWFVDLAPLTAAELATLAVAQALGVREAPGESLEDALARALETRELLLILDNCEHLLTESAHLVEPLLQRCSGLRILATSREPLAVMGERVWRLGPLGVPAHDLEATPGLLSNCESAILFVDRAVAVRADFQITTENAPVVASLCRRLDGIPLALQLAAARLRVLSVEQLAQRLEKRLDLLSGGSRTALPRHQTLRAAIDWSHELLGPGARAVFRRLGVFRDGFTLEAAEAVCAGDPIATFDVLELLTELVDKSLVNLDTNRREPRYRLLETLREYALGCLRESDEVSATRERLAHYFLALAERSLVSRVGEEREQLNRQLHAEDANLRAVLEEQAVASAAPQLAVRLAIALGPYWHDRWRLREMIYWSGQLLTNFAADCSAADRAWLSYWAALAAYRASGCEVESLRLVLAEFRAANERRGVAYVLNDLGFVAMDQDRPAEAVRYYEESLVVRRQLGDPGGIAMALSNLGETACALGDRVRGETLFREAIAIQRSAGPSSYLSDTLYNLGDQLLRREDLEAAERALCEALQVALSVGADYYVAKTLLGLGRLLVQRGVAGEALTLFVAASKALESLGARLEKYASAPYEAARTRAQAALGALARAKSEARGRNMTLAEASAYGLAVVGFRAA